MQNEGNSSSVLVAAPFDAHVHLRNPGPGGLLEHVLSSTATLCSRATIMPNTQPPILTGEQAEWYRAAILSAAAAQGVTDFEPVMTIKLTITTTTTKIEQAAARGVRAAKWYPLGVTTNAEDGLPLDWHIIRPLLRALESVNMRLLVHAEHPDPQLDCLKKEEEFIQTLAIVFDNHPDLRVVVEHVSSAAMVRFIQRQRSGVAGSITLHHLLMTLNDVVGFSSIDGRMGLHPHHFCMPIAKQSHDRDLLRGVVCNGDPRFFLGSDSAPHVLGKKLCDCGAAGVFSSPVLFSRLAELFFTEWAMNAQAFERFTSSFAESFYGLPPTQKKMLLEPHEWVVPSAMPGPESTPGYEIVPFLAGRTMRWRAVPAPPNAG